MTRTLNETKLRTDTGDIRHAASLTAAEIANFWQGYLRYTMLKCVYTHFRDTVEDAATRRIVETGMELINTRVKAAASYLERANIPVPAGFTGEDVNSRAPRLYSDTFFLQYTLRQCEYGLGFIGASLSSAARYDVREFFSECIAATTSYLNLVVDVALAKGVYLRSPIISAEGGRDFVKKRSFLSGVLVEPRPLLLEEAGLLDHDIKANLTGRSLLTGFKQTAKSEKVRGYIEKGIEIATSIINSLHNILAAESIPVSMPSEEYVTKSTESPFSDRLMLYHTITLSALGLTSYMRSLTLSPRHDIDLIYGRLMGEVAKYSMDGLNLMIDSGWYEEPPQVSSGRKPGDGQ
ncbi:MAG: DUF3231 family protein [bacterium]